MTSLAQTTDARQQHPGVFTVVESVVADAAADYSRACRHDRIAAREGLKAFTSVRRVRNCGLPLGDHGVAVKYDPTSESVKTAGFSGLSTCGSVWACPVCANKVAVQRALDLAGGITRWTAAGNTVQFLTLTVQHKKGDSLETLWEAVRIGWQRIVSGKNWQRDKLQHNISGYLRATEATYGKNGWHLHFHVLLFTGPDGMSDYARQALSAELHARWTAGLAQKGLTASLKHGIDLKPMKSEAESLELAIAMDAAVGAGGLGEYVAKSGVLSDKQVNDGRNAAREMLGGQQKQARMGNLTPFGILGVALELREQVEQATNLDVRLHREARRWTGIWRTWEKFSRGKRQMTMSNGLKDLLGLTEAEKTDEELAEDTGLNSAIIGVLSRSSYMSLLRGSPRLLGDLLSFAEDGGAEGLSTFADLYGLEISTDAESIAAWEKAQEQVIKKAMNQRAALAAERNGTDLMDDERPVGAV